MYTRKYTHVHRQQQTLQPSPFPERSTPPFATLRPHCYVRVCQATRFDKRISRLSRDGKIGSLRGHRRGRNKSFPRGRRHPLHVRAVAYQNRITRYINHIGSGAERVSPLRRLHRVLYVPYNALLQLFLLRELRFSSIFSTSRWSLVWWVCNIREKAGEKSFQTTFLRFISAPARQICKSVII